MQIRYLEYSSLLSTNSEAERLLKEESVEESIVIRADYQHSGRGQADNKWQSNKGDNVLLSWIVFPAFLSVQDQFILSKAVSLAITDFLDSFGLKSQIKWPNDIICNNRKIGGILIENRILDSNILSSTIGIGLNIMQEEFPAFPFPATSLSNEAEGFYDVSKVFHQLMKYLKRRYRMLEGGELEEINKAYLQSLYKKCVPGIFESQEGEFEGTIQGVDKYGCIVIKEGDILHTFGFHEVKMKI